ncbi:MAG: hypothetical protein JKX85_09135 [Phycisphaeraceae bacterium]|nr:hypothetical protein [Phycisphaeraceae bacterium]
MKRIIGIIVGLSLGWLAAGYVSANTASPKHDAHAQVTSDHSQEHHALAVEQITQGAVEGAPWLPCILVVTVGLFGGAIFVNLMGWAKPELAEDDDGHDADHH